MKNISVITGASSGLGLAIAKEMINNNYNVCLIARNETSLNNAKEKLEKLNSNVDIKTYNFNIKDEESIKDFYNELVKEYNVENLFNCAGVGVFSDPTETTKEKLDMVLESNLIGLILMTTNALKYMESGKIINIMSTAATKGNAKESIYCAAKWGAKGYTEALKTFYKGTNIKIMGVYPGGMNTPFWDKEYSLEVNKTKFMDPEEVAKQIVYATTNGNSIYVSDIIIDRK